MAIEIKELVIRATIDTEKRSTKRPDRSRKKHINKLHRRMDQLQQMIKQKNER
ncbi:hypothetical protein SAMN05443144_10664 [Fodinibius roseus]|uniref:Uncharacterized protein n=1 Tax=Fodinibius roseus TaxID=1194090 RepID=A0A1M4ZKZ6_9BACT|nr:DUF5908 family protein [Fodinibius roseus]SHF18713.1 hypothetical protein SAMN05443144_10664 [Fodinibius roseus]